MNQIGSSAVQVVQFLGSSAVQVIQVVQFLGSSAVQVVQVVQFFGSSAVQDRLLNCSLHFLMYKLRIHLLKQP